MRDGPVGGGGQGHGGTANAERINLRRQHPAGEAIKREKVRKRKKERKKKGKKEKTENEREREKERKKVRREKNIERREKMP